MRSYELETLYLGCHASDFSKPLLRGAPLFDVILTDPPYGVREASLKVGKRATDVEQSQFSLSEQFLELLNFAARSLVIGEICCELFLIFLKIIFQVIFLKSEIRGPRVFSRKFVRLK